MEESVENESQNNNKYDTDNNEVTENCDFLTVIQSHPCFFQ